ncbi:MAG: M67 family metallopeptidase [Mariprofundaceae bacterium]
MPSHSYEPERFRSLSYLNILAATASSQSATFTPSSWQDMQNIAAEGYPNEICGLLLGQTNAQAWIIQEVRQVTNLNTERATDRFQLDPAAYQKIDREIRHSDLDIIGVFHSHPDCPAKPSPTDLASAWEGFLYPIVSVVEGKVDHILCWEPHDQSQKFHPVSITSNT